MKKAEKIIGFICIIGVLLKFLLVPGSGILTVVSLSSLTAIYMYLSFALLNNVRLRNIPKKGAFAGTSRNKIIGAIGVGFALAATLTGILFKLQSYPGAQVNLVIGVLAILCVGIVAFIKYQKDKSAYYTGIFKRMAIYGGIALIMLCIPAKTWIEIKYRNHPAYRDALEKAVANPDNQELWKKADSIMDNMEKKGEM